MKNRKIILTSRPSGEATFDNFKLIEEEVPALGANEILVKAKYFSVDPYMRNRMNAIKSYVAPYVLNEAISGDAIAEVINSNTSDFRKGDIVTGVLGWSEFSVLKPNHIVKINPTTEIPATVFLGVLGLTGLTAYFGLLDIGQPKPEETIVVSGASGAVGSVAGQIAKIKGCRVIGIAGSEEKIDYLTEELEFDNAINYKQFPNIRKVLKKACPEGIDVYFDNVGGEISDAVFYLLRDYARIVLSGQISLYNLNRLSMGPRLHALLIIHRVTMQGFIVYDYAAQFAQARDQLAGWIRAGKVKYRENIVDGFENLPKAFLGLFTGDNIGKQLVRV